MTVEKSIQATLPKIVSDPGYCGGKPRVEGTRLPVHTLISYWHAYADPDRMYRAFPGLPPHGLESVLAYYAQHRDEVDNLIEEEAEFAYSLDDNVIG